MTDGTVDIVVGTHALLGKAVTISRERGRAILLDSGAELDWEVVGHSPLTLAASRGHSDMALLLIRRGANV